MGPGKRVTTTLKWPFGMAWTAWHYLWRILPVHRTELEGALPADLPPSISPEVAHAGLQQPDDGSGPLFHRTYQAAIHSAKLGPEDLMARFAADPNAIAPGQLARFNKVEGEDGVMRAGDEFVVHMPGPWNGPVRVVDVGARHFRFATLDGHLEAGQIEWRAWQDDQLHFAVESWARGGDRLSALMHDTLRMAKEVQLYMWTSIVERAAREAGGGLVDGVHVETRRVPAETFTTP